MQFLKMLESLRNPALDSAFGILTYLGSEYLFILISLVLFWCVDKHSGYRFFYLGLSSGVLNQFLKAMFCVQRPWMEDLSLSVVRGAMDTALGYSFPSGHTQSTATVAAAIALTVKKRWVTIASAIVTILVAFSRMYLGVHTPLDVTVALAVGVLVAFVCHKLWEKAKDKDRLKAVLWAGLLVFSLMELLYVFFGMKPQAEAVAQEQHARETACVLFGVLAGLVISMGLEKRYIRFSVSAPWWAQVMKVVCGIGLIVLLRQVVLSILPEVFGDWGGISLSYFLLMLFAVVLWPMTFPFWSGFKKGKGS